jgi:hypothetical protein
MNNLISTYGCSQNYERLWNFILENEDKEVIVFNQMPSGLYSFGTVYHGASDECVVLHWGRNLFSYSSANSYSTENNFESFVKYLTALKVYFIIA